MHLSSTSSLTTTTTTTSPYYTLPPSHLLDTSALFHIFNFDMPSSVLLPSPPASPTPQYPPPPAAAQQQPSRRKRAAYSSSRVIPSLRRHETMLFGDPLKTVPCQSQDNCSFESLSGSSSSGGSAATSQESIRTEAC